MDIMSGIRIYGGQTAGFFLLKNVIDNDSTITATSSKDSNLTWDYNTILYAKFNNTLDAGNITNLTEIITYWDIYRKKTSDSQSKLVAKVDSTVNTIKDYIISNKDSYLYSIIPLTQNYVGDAIYSNTVTTNFWNWSLTGINSHDVFKFSLNVEEGNITVNSNI